MAPSRSFTVVLPLVLPDVSFADRFVLARGEGQDCRGEALDSAHLDDHG
ncbi:hypothetical protein ABT269_36245 [Streptomyces viridosporus]